jgi:hypothetical protein
MDTQKKLLAGLAGAVAAVAGLIAGLLPVAATGGGSCGSAFAPASHGLGQPDALISVWCAQDLGPRRALAIALLVVGLAVVAAVIATWNRTSKGPGTSGVDTTQIDAQLAAGTLTYMEYADAKAALLQQLPGEPRVHGQ